MLRQPAQRDFGVSVHVRLDVLEDSAVAVAGGFGQHLLRIAVPDQVQQPPVPGQVAAQIVAGFPRAPVRGPRPASSAMGGDR